MRKHIRIAGYPRVSDENLKDSPTLDSQEADIRRYIAAHEGYELCEEHMYPEAMTAYYLPFRDRPQLIRLLDAARRHEFDVVVVTEYSRLSRRQLEQAVIIGILESYGVKVESCTEQFDDSPVGHFMRNVYAFLAEIERTKIVYRTTRGRKDRVAAGNLTGQGQPIYGYSYIDSKSETNACYVLKTEIIYVDEEQHEWSEVLVVEYIFDLALQGCSNKRIALVLTHMGIPSPFSGQTRKGVPLNGCWNGSTIQNILTNRAYIGEAYAFRYRREEGQRHFKLKPQEEHIRLADGLIPPIIQEDVFARVQETLLDNKQFASRNNKQPEVGIMRAAAITCGICGRRLGIDNHNNTNTKSEYVCRVNRGIEGVQHHHSTTITVDILDRDVMEVILIHLKDPQMIRRKVAALKKKAVQHINVDELKAKLIAVKKKFANLWELAEDATDAEELGSLKLRLKLLEKEKRDLQTMIEQVEEDKEDIRKLQEALTKFETWAMNSHTLLQRGYQANMTELRMAVKVLGIQVTVWPKSYPKRVEVTVMPPSVATEISCYPGTLKFRSRGASYSWE